MIKFPKDTVNLTDYQHVYVKTNGNKVQVQSLSHIAADYRVIWKDKQVLK